MNDLNMLVNRCFPVIVLRDQLIFVPWNEFMVEEINAQLVYKSSSAIKFRTALLQQQSI